MSGSSRTGRVLPQAAGAAAAALLALAPSGAAVAGVTTGNVAGIVRLVAPSGPPIESGAYPSRRVSRPGTPAPEISHVVVFLKDAPAGAVLEPQHARMMQQDEAFVPAVLAIPRGSTVDFPNADPFFHNVFSLSRGAAFDLGRYRRGDSRSRVFSQPGLVKVYCHLHSHMAASILVFDHPWFTIPSGDGTFALRDVPPGTYELVAWHERVGESIQRVTIASGQTARAEFALPVVEP